MRNLDSLTGFVKTVLTTTDYFPKMGTSLTQFSGDSRQIREFAADLFHRLGAVLSTHQRVEVKERSAATYFCVELDRVTVAQLCAMEGGITPAAIDLVREGAHMRANRHVHLTKQCDDFIDGYAEFTCHVVNAKLAQTLPP